MWSENVEQLASHDLNGHSGFKLASPRCTYELNQPAVLSFKHEVLDEQGAIASGIRTAVAADLRVDWPKTPLRRPPFRHTQNLFTFLALAQRVHALAEQELAAGHTVNARGAYLRASTYSDMCLYFILGTDARAQEAARRPAWR
jgi:hypothetical protein